MKKSNIIVVAMASILAGCASAPTSEQATNIYSEADSLIPMLSKQRQLDNSVENNYDTFRELNYKSVKANNEDNQLKLLQKQIGHNVMDLVSNLSDLEISKPIIIRPVKIDMDERFDASKGQVLLESLLELHFNKYGFTVFNDRKPKGRLSGEEYVLDSEIIAVNDKIVFQSTLKPLNSNKVTALQQSFISSYFFKNIQDGVEVWSSSRAGL